jgi:hypothetical protein
MALLMLMLKEFSATESSILKTLGGNDRDSESRTAKTA